MRKRRPKTSSEVARALDLQMPPVKARRPATYIRDPRVFEAVVAATRLVEEEGWDVVDAARTLALEFEIDGPMVAHYVRERLEAPAADESFGANRIETKGE